MYTVAGLVSEKLANGTSWENLVKENLFSLLGMTDSGFIHVSDENLQDVSIAYMKVKDGLKCIPNEIHRYGIIEDE